MAEREGPKIEGDATAEDAEIGDRQPLRRVEGRDRREAAAHQRDEDQDRGADAMPMIAKGMGPERLMKGRDQTL